MTTTIIQTERLLLEILAENDADFIMELLNTEGWIKFIGNRNINSKEDASAYIQKVNDNPNITYFSAKLKDSKIPIGLITIIKRDYLEHKDIGFAFLPNYSNKGYAFEGAKSVMNYLKNQNLDTHILASIFPENSISIKLVEKLGLQFEKQIEEDNLTIHIYSAKLLD